MYDNEQKAKNLVEHLYPLVSKEIRFFCVTVKRDKTCRYAVSLLTGEIDWSAGMKDNCLVPTDSFYPCGSTCTFELNTDISVPSIDNITKA